MTDYALAQKTVPVVPFVIGASVSLTHEPALLKGVKVDPSNPMRMEFIISDQLSADSAQEEVDSRTLRAESRKLIKYFLAALTTPEDEMWVNLSPYESDRIVPEGFGQTEMGRDLLAQDYLLKQLTSSLLHPDNEHGKKFWDKVYAEAFEKYGTTEVPVETFHKVWIVPDQAVVYEKQQPEGPKSNVIRQTRGSSRMTYDPMTYDHDEDDASSDIVAYVTKARMKVLLERDYVAAQETNDKRQMTNEHSAKPNGKSMVTGHVSLVDSDDLSSEIMREIIIPAIEDEVNEGETFALLRQIYHSMILATWYKRKLKSETSNIKREEEIVSFPRKRESQHSDSDIIISGSSPNTRGDDTFSILFNAFINKNKTAGVEHGDVEAIPNIYDQYVNAFKQGAHDFIRDEMTNDQRPVTNEGSLVTGHSSMVSSGDIVSRRYFSGGATFKFSDRTMTTTSNPGELPDNAMRVEVDLKIKDRAMVAAEQWRGAEIVYTSGYPYWMPTIRDGRRTDITDEQTRKGIFGGFIDSWLFMIDQHANQVGRSDLMEEAVDQMVNDESFRLRLDSEEAEFAIEVIRYAVENELDVGTKNFQRFSTAVRSAINETDWPRRIKEKARIIYSAFDSYVSDIVLLGSAEVQRRLTTDEYVLLTDDAERLAFLTEQLRPREYGLANRANMDTVFSILPFHIAPGVTRRDLRKVNLTVQRFHHLRKILKRNKSLSRRIDRELKNQEPAQRGAWLVEQIERFDNNTILENVSARKIWTGLPDRITPNVTRFDIPKPDGAMIGDDAQSTATLDEARAMIERLKQNPPKTIQVMVVRNGAKWGVSATKLPITIAAIVKTFPDFERFQVVTDSPELVRGIDERITVVTSDQFQNDGTVWDLFMVSTSSKYKHIQRTNGIINFYGLLTTYQKSTIPGGARINLEEMGFTLPDINEPLIEPTGKRPNLVVVHRHGKTNEDIASIATKQGAFREAIEALLRSGIDVEEVVHADLSVDQIGDMGNLERMFGKKGEHADKYLGQYRMRARMSREDYVNYLRGVGGILTMDTGVFHVVYQLFKLPMMVLTTGESIRWIPRNDLNFKQYAVLDFMNSPDEIAIELRDFMFDKSMLANPEVVEALRDTPAWEVFNILGIMQPADIPDAWIRSSLLFRKNRIFKVRLPNRFDPQTMRPGMQLLYTDQYSLFYNRSQPIYEFDFFFNESNLLTAIIPLRKTGARIWSLADYMFTIPQFYEEDFVDQWRTRQRFHQSERGKWVEYISNQYSGTDLAKHGIHNPPMSLGFMQYAHHFQGVYENKHIVSSIDSILERLELVQKRADADQWLIPLLPSVLFLGGPLLDTSDDDFHVQIAYSHELKDEGVFIINKGDPVLEFGIGPGTATTLLARRSGGKVYGVDINPMAVLNARMTAKIVGFDLEAKVNNGIVDVRGNPIFSDTKFKKVVGNFPAIDPEQQDAPKEFSYRGQHDHVSPKVLEDFLKHLPKMLDPDDHQVMIWNVVRRYPGGKDFVLDTIRRYGYEVAPYYSAKDNPEGNPALYVFHMPKDVLLQKLAESDGAMMTRKESRITIGEENSIFQAHLDENFSSPSVHELRQFIMKHEVLYDAWFNRSNRRLRERLKSMPDFFFEVNRGLSWQESLSKNNDDLLLGLAQIHFEDQFGVGVSIPNEVMERIYARIEPAQYFKHTERVLLYLMPLLDEAMVERPFLKKVIDLLDYQDLVFMFVKNILDKPSGEYMSGMSMKVSRVKGDYRAIALPLFSAPGDRYDFGITYAADPGDHLGVDGLNTTFMEKFLAHEIGEFIFDSYDDHRVVLDVSNQKLRSFAKRHRIALKRKSKQLLVYDVAEALFERRWNRIDPEAVEQNHHYRDRITETYPDEVKREFISLYSSITANEFVAEALSVLFLDPSLLKRIDRQMYDLMMTITPIAELVKAHDGAMTASSVRFTRSAAEFNYFETDSGTKAWYAPALITTEKFDQEMVYAVSVTEGGIGKIDLSMDGLGSEEGLMVYHISQGKEKLLNGVEISSEYRRKGLLRPLLNLYFMHFGVEHMRDMSPHVMLQDFLIRHYGFGPEEGGAPTAWFRDQFTQAEYDAMNDKNRDPESDVRYQVYFEDPTFVGLVFGEWNENRSKQYEVLTREQFEASDKRDLFRGVYPGKKLVVKDRAKFEQAKLKTKVDYAMTGETPGGIDLNPNSLQLSASSSQQLIANRENLSVNINCLTDEDHPQCVQFNFSPEQLEQLRDGFDGLEPVIINIQPISKPNLRIFLGLDESVDDTNPVEVG